MLAGDIITAIDGKSLLSMQQGQAMERLSGEVGTRLALQLLRDGESISVNLVRQQLEIESVSTRMIDNIGYIQITSFNAKTAEQFANAMTTMNSVGAKALIVDVRQNPRRSSQRPETNTKPVRSVRDSRYCGILRRQPQDPH